MTIEFFMFEEICVIVPFSLVKERFVSSTHLNFKKRMYCFVFNNRIFEGHSTLFLYLRFIVCLVADHLMIVVSYHYIVHMQNIYKTLCNHTGLNTQGLYLTSDKTALFYVHGLS